MQYGTVVIFRLCQLGKPSARSRQMTGILSNTYKPHSSKKQVFEFRRMSVLFKALLHPGTNLVAVVGSMDGTHYPPPPRWIGFARYLKLNYSWSRHAIAENESFRDSNLFTQASLNVEWHQTFLMLIFNTTFKFLSNFLCNWHELYYSPTFFRLPLLTDPLISY